MDRRAVTYLIYLALRHHHHIGPRLCRLLTYWPGFASRLLDRVMAMSADAFSADVDAGAAGGNEHDCGFLFRRLAQLHGWSPAQVAALTLAQVRMYIEPEKNQMVWFDSLAEARAYQAAQQQGAA